MASASAGSSTRISGLASRHPRIRRTGPLASTGAPAGNEVGISRPSTLATTSTVVVHASPGGTTTEYRRRPGAATAPGALMRTPRDCAPSSQ
jgi:hypothetical protein